MSEAKTKYERPSEWMYDEKKKGRHLMLTDSAAKMLGKKALGLGITKSEVLERAIRSGGLDAAEHYEVAKN